MFVDIRVVAFFFFHWFHLTHTKTQQAADTANKGLASLTEKLGETEHMLETVARRFLDRVRAHAPSLASVGAAANVGVEGVEQRARQAEGFVESVIAQTAAAIRAHLPSMAGTADSANVAVEQAGRMAEAAEQIAEVQARRWLCRIVQ